MVVATTAEEEVMEEDEAEVITEVIRDILASDEEEVEATRTTEGAGEADTADKGSMRETGGRPLLTGPGATPTTLPRPRAFSPGPRHRMAMAIRDSEAMEAMVVAGTEGAEAGTLTMVTSITGPGAERSGRRGHGVPSRVTANTNLSRVQESNSMKVRALLEVRAGQTRPR